MNCPLSFIAYVQNNLLKAVAHRKLGPVQYQKSVKVRLYHIEVAPQLVGVGQNTEEFIQQAQSMGVLLVQTEKSEFLIDL